VFSKGVEDQPVGGVDGLHAAEFCILGSFTATTVRSMGDCPGTFVL